jgi:hypothetical protein
MSNLKIAYEQFSQQYAQLGCKGCYYYWFSALGPVRAETRAQSGDWYGSGTLHPGQILRGSLPLLYVCILMAGSNDSSPFVIKQIRCTNFTNLFCHETTCFGQFVCPSSGVYSLYTQKWSTSYRFVDSFRTGPGPARKLSSNLYDIYQYRVYSGKLLMMGRGTARNVWSFMPE